MSALRLESSFEHRNFRCGSALPRSVTCQNKMDPHAEIKIKHPSVQRQQHYLLECFLFFPKELEAVKLSEFYSHLWEVVRLHKPQVHPLLVRWMPSSAIPALTSCEVPQNHVLFNSQVALILRFEFHHLTCAQVSLASLANRDGEGSNLKTIGQLLQVSF